MAELNKRYGFKTLSPDENSLLTDQQKAELLKEDRKQYKANKRWFDNQVSVDNKGLEAAQAKLPIDYEPNTLQRPNPSAQSSWLAVLENKLIRRVKPGKQTVTNTKLLTVNDIDRLKTSKVVVETAR